MDMLIRKNYLYDRIIAIVKNTRVRDQEEKNKKKKYVKFPKRLERQKKTVSEQLQDELEPIISTPINSPMSDE